MPLQRRISWNAALRDMHADRNRVASGVVSARSLIQGLGRIRRTCLFTPTGAFDRKAIMASAVEAAKAHRLRTGAAWSVSISVGLTAAWQAAKAARLSVVTRDHAPVERVRETSRNINIRPVKGDGTASAADHGGAPSSFPLRRSPLNPLARGRPGAAAGPIPAPR